MVKICVFDTETTDKPPILPGKDWNERTKNDSKLLDFKDLNSEQSFWNQVLSNWPSIIQLSYIIYDLDNPKNTKLFNKYIDIPENITITESSFAIHHINKEFIKNLPNNKKVTIEEALTEFLNDAFNPEVQYIVGHNVQFDRKMIIAEILRLQNNKDLFHYLELMMNNNFACTMNDTSPSCNLQMEVKYKDKKTGEDKVFFKIKSPKLLESYFHYFGYEPKGEALHDAIIDVVLCLRVFMKYKYNMDICGTNEVITEYIKNISPEGYICPVDITKEVDEKVTELLYGDKVLDFSKITLNDVEDKSNNKKLGGSKKNKKRKKNKKNTKKSRRK
jgi:DNA polymerase III epsilon subunit-like protein